MTVAQVQGYQKDAGIMATAKHFPGHGDTRDDSHTALPTINHTLQEWNTIDAPPFKAAIKAGIDSIMTAHIVVPSLDPSGDPATLSKPILTGVLRDQLGFKGLIITDALEMAAVRAKYGDAEVAVRAIEAGADQILLPPAPDVQFNAVVDAVKSGRISERQINESLLRILLMKLKNGVLFQPFVDPAKIPSVVGTPASLAAAQKIVDKSITLVKNNNSTLPLANTPRKVLVTGWGVATTASLGTSLTNRGATTTVAQTGAAPTDAAIADAVAKAQVNDVTVVLTQKAWDTTVTDKLAKQQKLVKDLLATGKTVIVVAVRDPYDIAYFDEAPTYLATYGYQRCLDGVAGEGALRRDRADGQAPGRHPGRRPAHDPALPVRPRTDLVTMKRRSLIAGAGALAAAPLIDVQAPKRPRPAARRSTGAEALAADDWRALAGQKVGVISNPTGILRRPGPHRRHHARVREGQCGRGVRARARLPRHGAGRRFRGRPHRPAHRDHGVRRVRRDRGQARRPLHKSGVETVVFDIQDVGARFYTYIWTMYEAMIAAVRHRRAVRRTGPARTRSVATRAARCSSPATPRAWARRRSSSSTA